LLYKGGDSCVTSGLAVFRVVALPENLLMNIKIGMGIVHLNDGETCFIF
jgi:hypothetical protein